MASIPMSALQIRMKQNPNLLAEKALLFHPIGTTEHLFNFVNGLRTLTIFIFSEWKTIALFEYKKRAHGDDGIYFGPAT